MRDQGPPLWLLLPGVFLVWFARFAWRTSASTDSLWSPSARPRLRAFRAGFLLVVAIVWTSAILVMLSNQLRAKRLLDSGNAPVIEGVITNFSATKRGERFSVDGVDFSAINSWPLNNGHHVRITYEPREDPFILKLELRDQVVCR